MDYIRRWMESLSPDDRAFAMKIIRELNREINVPKTITKLDGMLRILQQHQDLN